MLVTGISAQLAYLINQRTNQTSAWLVWEESNLAQKIWSDGLTFTERFTATLSVVGLRDFHVNIKKFEDFL